jgi:hypothetical protein
MAGRCLGLLEALLVQAGAGICTESIVTVRAIHEATRLLQVLGDPDEDDLLRRWLDDDRPNDWVRPKVVRDALDRADAKLAEAMEAAGVPRLPGMREQTEDLYDQQSRVGHSRRSAVLDSVCEPARAMFYGYHPSLLRRAAYAELAVAMTFEVTQAVGSALEPFYGVGFYRGRIVPLVEAVQAVEQASPLDEQSIRREAGTG